MSHRGIKLLLAMLATLSLVVTFLAATLLSGGPTTTSNCQQIERIKQSIRASVTQSLSTLGKPGTSGYAYYREHPTELADAIASAKITEAHFAPSSCG